MKKIRALLLAFFVGVFSLSSASALPPVPREITVTGGNGSPLSITFDNGIDLWIDGDASYALTTLVFAGIYSGPTLDGSQIEVNGFDYTVDGNSDPYALEAPYLQDIKIGGNFSDTDLLLTFSNYLPEGKLLQISAGTTITTKTAWTSDPGAFNSLFSFYLADDVSGAILSESLEAEAFLPDPVPEPSTYVLLGIAGLGWVGYRRRLRVG